MTTTPAWTHETIDVNGIEIHFTRTGGDKTPLVVLHGITDNGLCWRRPAQVWQAAYDVIMVDVRGHGLSSAPDIDDAYTVASMREDVVALITALNLERAGLVGHSMGALIASEIAAYHPDRVGFLMLEDPPWDEARYGITPEERSQMAEEWRDGIIQYRSLTPVEIIALHKDNTFAKIGTEGSGRIG